MKCPIMVIGRMNSNDPSDISYTECLREACAWWATWSTAKLPMVSGCAVALLASGMALLNGAMPKEYQFRDRG